MATKQNIVDAVSTQLVTTLERMGMDKDTAATHVEVANSPRHPDLPGYRVECFESDLTRGIGSNVEVHDSVVDEATDTATVTRRRRREATFDILAFAADGDHRTVNDLYDELDETFVGLVDDPTALHPDVDEIEIEGTQDVTAANDHIRGDRHRIVVEYLRFYDGDEDLMGDIHVDMTVNESTGPDTTDDADTDGQISFTYLADSE